MEKTNDKREDKELQELEVESSGGQFKELMVIVIQMSFHAGLLLRLGPAI